MQYRQLGHSDLIVSQLCLGTMTWGEQNTAPQAHAQIDFALERGINFLDAAEMYPVPGKAETQGRTEEIIGEWLRKTGKRSEVLLATKVTGPSRPMHWIRGEENKLDRANIRAALEGSLQRLGVDCVDLYQVHWPERPVNNFGRLNYPGSEAALSATPIQDTLAALHELVQEGKIRWIGLSNETPWGITEYLRAARETGLSRVVSLQNPMNLLNRTLEIGISEVLHRENIGLLPYSTLAFGWLTGKYDRGARPARSRLGEIGERFNGRYFKDHIFAAAEQYNDLARSWGISPAQMALAWINQHPAVTSNIIGATTLEQLAENIGSLDIHLDQDQLNAIDALQAVLGNPAP
jgi:aryl-alcohol dehydrogenase-like predicted oxidoreductase